jgi:phospholipid/cholesterol/gamma-HCH transport system substrate-binding protein
MRRLAAIALAVTALAVVSVLAAGGMAQGSSSARFDVIFDDARGLVAGQLVKIAGAQAGTIQNVVLTPGFKARVEATVDSRFMPFHQDATCAIRPEGLIAENYVECDPGSASSPPLSSIGGHPPTVPVTQTTEPVSLLDLFNIFNEPTSERLTVLVNELGIGTAARGEDINDILLRANPALALARQVISILTSQQAQLGSLVDATNTIAADAAHHTPNIQRFLTSTAALTTVTANHHTQLALAINRLPALLAAAQPALSALDTVAVDGTPLVQQIHASVPGLDRVAADLGPFAAAAKPGLASLSDALAKTIPALHALAPVVSELTSYAARSKSGTLLTRDLFENLQRHGFIENFLSIAYYISASLARFDQTSHLLSILLVSPQNGACGLYATTPVPGCSAHYGTGPAFTPVVRASVARASAARASHSEPSRRAAVRRAPRQRRSAHRPTATQPQTTQPPTVQAAPPQSPTSPATTAAAGASSTPGSPQQGDPTLQGLINYLLK